MRVNESIHVSPFSKLKRLDSDAVRWTDGFWAQKLTTVKNDSLPSVLAALNDKSNATYFPNFKNAGSGTGAFVGVDWSDGDCYKSLETMILFLDLEYDAALDAQIDGMISEIASAQEDDGYICTQITLTGRPRWTNIHDHELYNFGHLLTVGVLHHQVTKKTSLLNVALRAADYLYDTFSTRDPELSAFCFNPSQIMGLVELYRETGEQRYLELAKIYIDNRGSNPKNPRSDLDQTQDRVPVRAETEAVGHAVTGPYLWAGAADLVMETNEQELLDAITRIWEDSTYRKMYITGGIGALHKGIAERSNPDYEEISEAYGRPFQLPNDSAYNETCANISNAMWSWRLLQLTGDARYADVMERVLFNSALSALSLDGEQFTYTNPLRFNGKDHMLISNDSPVRWKTWRCYCCPPQITRTIAGLHRWTYSTGENAVWVHLYGANTINTDINGAKLSMTQSSNYPWGGDIRFEVEAAPEGELTIHLRIPGWTPTASLTVNGDAIGVPVGSPNYVAVTRTWSAGDVIELSFDTSPQVLTARPEVEEARSQAAVICGPLVYCLEGADLPDGTSIDDVVLRSDTQFEVQPGVGLFEGLRVLSTDLQLRSSWTSHELYAPLAKLPAATVKATLIPYFAWNNRPDNTMSVWLPLQYG
ncbi:glycoside hydrolase family 127 protein [Cognatishimia sp. SS12]|uniref:glycoside hydrolase family 127 protein n=1 Tax=Cognatishimia sp. SS12 TaxID=2979465 RepID=UPI00232E08DE|nr:beta-L-arabinofuranosidase domain-containing protein [Cognatishimia sp. SS12]MDC0739607.1 glycoside hydrolase family 127 protein [Cognatishimia sp. SS12]